MNPSDFWLYKTFISRLDSVEVEILYSVKRSPKTYDEGIKRYILSQYRSWNRTSQRMTDMIMNPDLR